MAPRRPPPRPTAIVVPRWVVDDVGVCRVKIPDARDLRLVDATWPQQRREKDAHRHWKWVEIAARSRECYAVVTQAGEMVALWAGKGAIELPEGRFYRSDYLEVLGRCRGGDLGYVCMALMWARGAEAGCKGLVFPSLPETAPIYDGMGGTRRCINGWQVDPRLVPFVFEGKSLETLAELLKDLRHEGGNDDEDETEG